MSEARIVVGEESALLMGQVLASTSLINPAAAPLTREQVCASIERMGIIPQLRLQSAEDAEFAVGALGEIGLQIVEISMKDPEALDILSHLSKSMPTMIVGAGAVLDAYTATRCLDAGAKFLASDAFVPGMMELARKEKVVALPAALTPTEILAAWDAGADFVRVSPCDAVGGSRYIRSVKSSMPQVRLVASGGVDHLTAAQFMRAGATAISVGIELVPNEAIWLRQSNRIKELGRRFLMSVEKGRA